MTLGNTTWKLHDVYFDTPNVDGTGKYAICEQADNRGQPSCATA